MRENTGTLSITTVNFGDGHYGNESATHEWTPAEIQTSYIEHDVISAYAAQHESNADQADYVADFGTPEVFEYQLPGLRVVALVHDGAVATIFAVADADLARAHTALRTGRRLSVRYVKADGEVTRRRLTVRSLSLSKAGDPILRADDDSRNGDTRSFRWDRVTHTTLHRATRRPAPAAPAKDELWADFQGVTPAGEFQPEPVAVEGQVRHTQRGWTGRVVPGTRGLSASGWNVIVKLDADFAHLTPGGTVRASEDELEAWAVCVTDIYLTTPGTAAALEAPEAVQDRIAERYALGHAYAFVTV